MTDRFAVPEPSAEAVDALRDQRVGFHLRHQCTEPLAAPPSAAPAKKCVRDCSWSAERLCDASCAVHPDNDLPNTCVRCAWMPDGSLAGRCERCGQAEAVDRDREGRTCTACGCAACADRLEFVRRLANVEALASLARYPSPWLLEAAKKVIA